MKRHLERYKIEKESICQCFDDIKEVRRGLLEDKHRLQKTAQCIAELELQVKTAMREQKRLRGVITGYQEDADMKLIRKIKGRFITISNTDKTKHIDQDIYSELAKNQNQSKHKQTLDPSNTSNSVQTDLTNPKNVNSALKDLTYFLSKLSTLISARNPKGPISLKNLQALEDAINLERSTLNDKWGRVSSRLDSMQTQLDAQNRKISLFKVDNYSKYYLDSLSVRKKENTQLLRTIRDAVEQIRSPVEKELGILGKQSGNLSNNGVTDTQSIYANENHKNSIAQFDHKIKKSKNLNHKKANRRKSDKTLQNSKTALSGVTSFFDESFGQLKLKSLLSIHSQTKSRFKHLCQRLTLPIPKPQTPYTPDTNTRPRQLSKSHRGQNPSSIFQLDLNKASRVVQTSRYTPNSCAAFATNKYEFPADGAFSKRFGDLCSSFRTEAIPESDKKTNQPEQKSKLNKPPIKDLKLSSRKSAQDQSHFVSSRRHRDRFERISQDLNHNMKLNRQIINKKNSRQEIKPFWNSQIQRTCSPANMPFETLGHSKLENSEPGDFLVKSQIPKAGGNNERRASHINNEHRSRVPLELNNLHRPNPKFGIPQSSTNLGRHSTDIMQMARSLQPSSVRNHISPRIQKHNYQTNLDSENHARLIRDRIVKLTEQDRPKTNMLANPSEPNIEITDSFEHEPQLQNEGGLETDLEYPSSSPQKRVYWGVEEVLERSPGFFAEINRRWFFDDADKTYEKVIQKMYKGLAVKYFFEGQENRPESREETYVGLFTSAQVKSLINICIYIFYI